MSTNFVPPPPPPAPPCRSPTSDQPSAQKRNYFECCHQSRTEILQQTQTNLEKIISEFESTTQEQKTVTAICTVIPIRPILQHGPLCGLVALGMVADHYTQNSQSGDLLGGDHGLDTMFERAKGLGMTRSGEMFSAQKMKELARLTLPSQVNCFPELVNTESEETRNQILKCLLNGDLIMIPYDADYNHAPALRNGNSAHWAVITGFVAVMSSSDLQILKRSIDFPVDADTNANIILLDSFTGQTEPNRKLTEEQKTKLQKFLQTNIESSQLYVCCRQGKSKHIGIWTYQNLMNSNQNLRDIGRKLTDRAHEYVLESIDLTLRSQAILLTRRIGKAL